MLRWCLASVLLAGCDLVFTVDVPEDCLASWERGPPAVGAPRLVSELVDPAPQFWPSLSADGRELYFARETGGSQERDIFVTTRTARGEPWAAPAPVAELATDGDEQRLTLDATGTIAVFAANRDGSTDLYYTTRPDRASPFGEPTRSHFDIVNTSLNGDFDPELSLDGTRLYYAPYLDDTRQYVRITSRSSDEQPFGPPADVGGLAITSQSGDPSLSSDERVLVFATGDQSGDNDVYFTVRESPAAAFGPPVQVPNVNLPGVDDSESELAPDGCELYFTSTRDGRYQLYVSEIER